MGKFSNLKWRYTVEAELSRSGKASNITGTVKNKSLDENVLQSSP